MGGRQPLECYLARLLLILVLRGGVVEFTGDAVELPPRGAEGGASFRAWLSLCATAL